MSSSQHLQMLMLLQSNIIKLSTLETYDEIFLENLRFEILYDPSHESL